MRECKHLLHAVGRLGELGEEHTRICMGLIIEGIIGYYGRATAIDWETCEKIESVRAEALKRCKLAIGRPRVQVHAGKEHGGLGHRHAYQHAVAALCDQFERILVMADGTPAEQALRAHVEATYVRLGWDGRGVVRGSE